MLQSSLRNTKKGTREMNNEPVAWILNGIIHEFDPSDWAKEQYPDQDVIPLYTHPVKELTLTDEEMISIYEKDWSEIKCGLGRAVEQAILRKAQE